MRIFLRQIVPAGAAPENSEDPFQHTTILDPRAAATARLREFGEQGREFLPLASMSNGPNRAIAPWRCSSLFTARQEGQL